MTKQEMFNSAYIGVIQQGQAGTRDGGCAYYRLTDNGPVMCGIGHVVGRDIARALAAGQHGALCDIWSNTQIECSDDEQLTSEAVSELIGDDIVKEWEFSNALQDAHDMAHGCAQESTGDYSNDRFLDQFKINMKRIADGHELTIPEVPSA